LQPEVVVRKVDRGEKTLVEESAERRHASFSSAPVGRRSEYRNSAPMLTAVENFPTACHRVDPAGV
jgi:hypothetical protein